MVKKRLTMALLGVFWVCCFGLVSAQVSPTAGYFEEPAGCTTCSLADCGGCGGWLSNFLYCDPCRPSDPWKLP
ncbi:MAG: hypothetical protein ACUVQG_13990, partial [Thermogutta sp.]